MGLFSEAKDRAQAASEVAAVSVAGCPDPLKHYEATVNKGSVNTTMFTGELSVRFRSGYRLAHMAEQNGNLLCVWEHSHS